ncbi:MAG: chorismate mutase [Pseudomonadota bacterium]
MEARLSPKSCKTMSELRVQIDSIDAELINLLASRSHFIDRAVELKKVEGLPVRITHRVAEVLTNVRETAAKRGLDPELAQTIWSEIIEWSIQREIKKLGSE